jgi:hypothetical protein
MADKVRIVQKYGTKTPRTNSTIFATRPRFRESTRSLKRSAYAFSHQEGFVALIRERKMMPEPSVLIIEIKFFLRLTKFFNNLDAKSY